MRPNSDFSLAIPRLHSIHQLKERLHESYPTQPPVSHQRLVHDGRLLTNDDTIASLVGSSDRITVYLAVATPTNTHQQEVTVASSAVDIVTLGGGLPIDRAVSVSGGAAAANDSALTTAVTDTATATAAPHDKHAARDTQPANNTNTKHNTHNNNDMPPYAPGFQHMPYYGYHSYPYFPYGPYPSAHSPLTFPSPPYHNQSTNHIFDPTAFSHSADAAGPSLFGLRQRHSAPSASAEPANPPQLTQQHQQALAEYQAALAQYQAMCAAAMQHYQQHAAAAAAFAYASSSPPPLTGPTLFRSTPSYSPPQSHAATHPTSILSAITRNATTQRHPLVEDQQRNAMVRDAVHAYLQRNNNPQPTPVIANPQMQNPPQPAPALRQAVPPPAAAAPAVGAAGVGDGNGVAAGVVAARPRWRRYVDIRLLLKFLLLYVLFSQDGDWERSVILAIASIAAYLYQIGAFRRGGPPENPHLEEEEEELAEIAAAEQQHAHAVNNQMPQRNNNDRNPHAQAGGDLGPVGVVGVDVGVGGAGGADFLPQSLVVNIEKFIVGFFASLVPTWRPTPPPRQQRQPQPQQPQPQPEQDLQHVQ